MTNARTTAHHVVRGRYDADGHRGADAQEQRPAPPAWAGSRTSPNVLAPGMLAGTSAKNERGAATLVEVLG